MIICSFSGGRSSGFMAAYLNTRYNEVINVFANTGKEHPATLKFVKQCDEHFKLNLVWLEYRTGNNFEIVDYHSASRKGQPFEELIKEKGLPTARARICTRDLKQRTIRRYLKSIGLMPKNYKMAIGIRIDERHRLHDQYYPLAEEMQATKDNVNSWWMEQSFDLEIPNHLGNCDFCFEKSLRKRRQSIDYSDWWHEMEIKYGNEVAPYFDVRNVMSVKDIKDEKRILDDQLEMFEYSCFCSST